MKCNRRLTGGWGVDFGDESERVAQSSLVLGFLLATPLTLSKKQKSEGADEGQGPGATRPTSGRTSPQPSTGN